MAATTKCSVTDHIPEGPLLSKTTSTLNCDTCSRQFDSSINYRRHMLTHDRTSNKDKELAGDRGLLQNYWDGIDKDDFTNVVSLMIKEEFRYAMLGCLELFGLKPRVIPPRAYVKAGNSLLDVVRSKWTKDRIGSEELFKILDDASEQTFLCSVIDDSVRTHVFEGDDDISPGNLGAHICFLFEEALVKHWNRHRLAQSLVDEEENEKQREANQKKENKNKGQMQNASKQTDAKKNQEGNRGDASDTLWSTETSRADAPPATEGSPTQVAQLVHVPDADKEGEFKQKEKISQELKCQDKNFQGMVNTSGSLQYGETDLCGAASENPIGAQVKQRDNLPNPFQSIDAEKKEDGGLKQKAETSEERKGEDEKLKDVGDASALLHYGKTLSCSLPSENLIDAQVTHPDQSLENCDAEKAADAECRQEGQETTSLCEVVSTPVQSHCAEKRVTPGTTTFLKFGKFPIDVDLTITASTSGGRGGINTTASTRGRREDTGNADVVHLPLRENLFTVFIDNIPEDKDSRWLRNLFSGDGKVMDVYIPSKVRRASKSRYGFVRYKSMEEAVAAINRWNTFKVGSYELGVKLAYNRGKPSGKERRFLLKGDEQGREPTKEWRPINRWNTFCLLLFVCGLLSVLMLYLHI